MLIKWVLGKLTQEKGGQYNKIIRATWIKNVMCLYNGGNCWISLREKSVIGRG